MVMRIVREESIRRVLKRLAIRPEDRIAPHAQDLEYTACRSDELDAYIDLYASSELDDGERGVLCCFILESMNEIIQLGKTHSRQGQALTMLFSNEELHRHELEYWMDASDPNEEDWWPITLTPLEFKKQASLRRSSK